MNKVILIGRLTKDPELRYTSNNIAVATFTIAVNREYANQNGEREADFINIQVWKKQAENCNKYLTKGSKVAIDGRIQTRNYEDQNGNRRYLTEVIADSIQFLDTRKNDNQTATQNDTKAPNNEFENMSVKTEVQQQFEYTDSDLPF